MAIVNELVTSLSFKLDPKAKETINAVVEQIKSMSKNIQTIADIGASSLKKLKDEAIAVANSMQKIDQFAQTSVLSRDSIQRWKYAAEVNKLSPSAILSDVKKIQQEMGGEQGLIDIMNRLSAASEQAAKEIIGKAQISEDFLKLIKAEGGTEGVFKLLQSTPLIVPDKDVENSALLAKNFEKISQALEKMKEKFLTGLSGPLNAQLEKTIGFLEEHNYFKDEIDKASEVVGGGLTRAFEIANDIVESAFRGEFPSLKKIGESFGKNATSDAVMSGALLAIASMTSKMLLALWPLAKLLIIADLVNKIYAWMTKGTEEFVNEVDKKIESGEATPLDLANPVTALAREYGHVGRKLADFWSILTTGTTAETKMNFAGAIASANMKQRGNVTYATNYIYPANDRQLQQTVEQVNGYPSGTTGQAQMAQ